MGLYTIKAIIKNFISEHPTAKIILIKILKLLSLYKRIYNDAKYPRFEKLGIEGNTAQTIYFDISSVVLNDQNAGIHRAMKIILQILIEKYSDRFLIIPIYFSKGFCYCPYAYVVKFNNTKLLNFINDNKYIENFVPQSIFLSIDINFFMSKSKKIAKWLIQQHSHTLFVKIIHDLIPILNPELSEEIFSGEFEEELRMNSLYFDQAICVSKSTMHDYKQWLIQQNIHSNIRIDWIHWGADIEKYKSHYDGNNIQDFPKDNYGEYFLMVSTIEPKKGYEDVLEAFDKLWSNGYNKSLVIVGREGFKTRTLIRKILNHPLLNKKLFWLNMGVSDTELIYLYENARAFIMASSTEGFGLGVIEAAKYHAPLILRNIPIFHEIAKDSAYYFAKDEKFDLATEILVWDQLYVDDLHPKSKYLSISTWEQSCDKIMNIIMK